MQCATGAAARCAPFLGIQRDSGHGVARRGATDDEKAAAARLRAPALRCLAPYLGLPDKPARRVLKAVGDIITDLFPSRSRELRPGSTQVRMHAVTP